MNFVIYEKTASVVRHFILKLPCISKISTLYRYFHPETDLKSILYST